MVFLVLFKIREAKIVLAKWQGTKLAKGEIISRSLQKNLKFTFKCSTPLRSVILSQIEGSLVLLSHGHVCG